MFPVTKTVPYPRIWGPHTWYPDAVTIRIREEEKIIAESLACIDSTAVTDPYVVTVREVHLAQHVHHDHDDGDELVIRRRYNNDQIG